MNGLVMFSKNFKLFAIEKDPKTRGKSTILKYVQRKFRALKAYRDREHLHRYLGTPNWTLKE